MGVTKFDNGVSSFGVPVLGSTILTSGSVFWVDSQTGQNGPGRGLSKDTPAATIAWALANLVTAGKHDTILAMPGHAESVTAAGTITASKSGVLIQGIGTGALRPTITWSTATGATITQSAANVTWRNFIFAGTGVDQVAAMFTITGAYARFEDCYFIQGDATNQAVLGLSLGTGADNCTVSKCQFQSRTAGATAFIQSVVAIDRLQVADCLFDGDTTAHIRNTTVAWTNALITHNHFYCLGSAKVAIVDNAATGFITWNVSLITANIAAGGSMTAAAMAKLQNYTVESAQVATSGIVDPAATGIA